MRTKFSVVTHMDTRFVLVSTTLMVSSGRAAAVPNLEFQVEQMHNKEYYTIV